MDNTISARSVQTPSSPGDHSVLVPPDPISNSEVKQVSANDSVGLPHVKVGHRRVLFTTQGSPIGWPFCRLWIHDVVERWLGFVTSELNAQSVHALSRQADAFADVNVSTQLN